MAFTVRSQFSTAGRSPVGTEDSDSPAPWLRSAMVTVMFHMRRRTSSSAATVGRRKPHLTQRDTATANRSNYGGADSRNDSFHLAFTHVGEGALYWRTVWSRLSISKRVRAFVAQNSFDRCLLTAVCPSRPGGDAILVRQCVSSGEVDAKDCNQIRGKIKNEQPCSYDGKQC